MNKTNLIPYIQTLVIYGTVCCFDSIKQTNVWTSVGSTITLKCSYTGYVSWVFKNYVLTDDCEINPAFFGKIMLSDQCKTGGWNDLHIVNVSVFDEGEYSCRYARRKILMMERITMKIKDIPDVPTNITIKTCFHGVSVSWQPGNSGNLHQVFYIQYREEGAQIWTTIGPINQTGSNDMTYQISNLPYNRLHEIQVFAENDVGRSKSSELVKCVVLVEHDIPIIWKSEIGLKCWQLVGIISAGIILICIMSHVWRHRRTQILVTATLALPSETAYEEIDSIFYQEHPPIPPTRTNVIITASTVETDRGNSVFGILNNNELEIVPQENINLESASQHNTSETSNARDSYSSSENESSTGAESDDKSSDDQTVRSIGHVNLYTSMIPDRYEDHSYSLLDVGNIEIRVHDDSDYINMRI